MRLQAQRILKRLFKEEVNYAVSRDFSCIPAYVGTVALARPAAQRRQKSIAVEEPLMKRLLLSVFAILLFTITPWAQTPARTGAEVIRVDNHGTKRRAHAHRRRTSRHRSRRHHST
jgi:hypothetical protein